MNGSREASGERFPHYMTGPGDHWEQTVAEETPGAVLELVWDRITFDIEARKSGTDEGTTYAELTADLLAVYMERAYGDRGDLMVRTGA